MADRPFIPAPVHSGHEPDAHQSAHQQGLEIAERHLGIAELAKRLHTTDSMIRAWRMGHATMPEYKFLGLVDILNELEPGWTDKAKP